MFTTSPAVRIASTRQNGMFFAEGPKVIFQPYASTTYMMVEGISRTKQPDRPELRRRLVDALGTDMPDEENEGEEADKEEDELKHGSWRRV